MKIGINYFQEQLLHLEPQELVGVVHMLGVPLLLEDNPDTPLPFESMYAGVIEKYAKLSRRQRKNLHRLLAAAIDGKDSND